VGSCFSSLVTNSSSIVNKLLFINRSLPVRFALTTATFPNFIEVHLICSIVLLRKTSVSILLALRKGSKQVPSEASA
jgi:hypothetical protein